MSAIWCNYFVSWLPQRIIEYTASVVAKVPLESKDILTVYTKDGKGTRWTRLVEEQTPAQVMMTIWNTLPYNGGVFRCGFPQDSTGCPVAKMRASLKFIGTTIKTVLKLAFFSSKPGGMLFSNVLEYSIWTPEWFYALSVECGKKNNVME